MRRKWITQGLLGALGLTALMGCQARNWTWLTSPNGGMETSAQDSRDHREFVNRVAEHDRQALGDDLDLVFMTDRQTRLTRWQDR